MNVFKKLIAYVKNSVFELSKITWPSKQESISLTIIVLISILASMLFLAGIDWGLSKIVNIIIENNG